MKKYLASWLLFIGLISVSVPQHLQAQDFTAKQYIAQADNHAKDSPSEEHVSQTETTVEQAVEHHHAPAWLVIPFVALLLMIATGPLFYENFWHHNYPKIAVGLAVLVVLYYLFVLGNVHNPVHALAEYIQFISLLASLFIASGGILIEVDKKSTPMANVILLVIGALISNLIGTTGASMLLIRPFIRLNKNNIQAYHIIFFIFMVSNIGGSLTPIGDPPLFLGFLKGVPFFWTLEHNWKAWILALTILSVLFYFVDRKFGNKGDGVVLNEQTQFSNKISLKGTKNFLWLLVIIISVFLDPNVLDWVPAIHYDGQNFSFIRETIMLSVAYFSYKFADQQALSGNEFNFEPIREVAFIFIGIFGTMMPALELVGGFAQSEQGAAMITHNTLYWGTGLLSGFLDNAPTYLNFLAAAMASQGADINSIQQVKDFAMDRYIDSSFELMAISIASVFFGAMTYVGNGPNFMVKSIAEQSGIKMPSFFGYILRFSIPILLPILFITWLVFFAFS
ncbi:sodium:proton antiporter [Cyclobacterium qasimii]|uniref:Citrate transporter n=2 Tax=Cyclobacterium qasimii TaxID=1350429 RepID=A0A512CI24_9BACT|nr:sodium:proton antiporter [Cyclobacterium qasimii]EPR66049.1 putative transmembrane protein [Cyclobacterium qasimii M12-11B]GEO23863.1 citrate transporter [Cyclobacterium qasimii]